MISKREQALKTVIDALGSIENACRLGGRAGLLDLNRVLQHFFCRFLSEAYSLSLIELDRIQPNFPAIDLGDTQGRRCFQITSDKSSEKVQATIDKYVEKRLYEKYGPIIILVIGERQREYKALRIPDVIRFDTDHDVLGVGDLVKYISTLDTPVLERMAEIVQTEFHLPEITTVQKEFPQPVFLVIGGTWKVDYLWQGVPGHEQVIIMPDGSYCLDQQFSSGFPPPLFQLTDATYDQSTRTVRFTKVSIRNGKRAEEWDAEKLVLSADERHMTGKSVRSGHWIKYTRILPQR